MAAHLDAQVEAFRNRPLDAGHYTFVWMDALTMKVREHGRTVNVHALIAVGVNADGEREVLGLDVASRRGRRRLAGVPAVADRPRPVRRPAGHLRRPPRPRRRDRRRPARRVLAALPHPLPAQPAHQGARSPRSRGSPPWSAPIFDQPDADAVRAQFDRVVATHRGEVPGRRRTPRRRPRRPAGLHRLPARDLAPDLVEQPAGTAEQGDPPPHRRRRDLPQPRRDHPPRRRRPRRTDRRMDRRTPLHGPGTPRQSPPHVIIDPDQHDTDQPIPARSPPNINTTDPAMAASYTTSADVTAPHCLRTPPRRVEAVAVAVAVKGRWRSRRWCKAPDRPPAPGPARGRTRVDGPGQPFRRGRPACRGGRRASPRTGTRPGRARPGAPAAPSRAASPSASRPSRSNTPQARSTGGEHVVAVDAQVVDAGHRDLHRLAGEVLDGRAGHLEGLHDLGDRPHRLVRRDLERRAEQVAVEEHVQVLVQRDPGQQLVGDRVPGDLAGVAVRDAGRQLLERRRRPATAAGRRGWPTRSRPPCASSGPAPAPPGRPRGSPSR